MKKLIALYLALVLLAMGLLNNVLDATKPASDEYIRDRVVLLQGNGGGCTGVQIKSPSGRVYILSAGHCRDLATNGIMKATTEQGLEVIVHIIKVDIEHDLLLLSAASNRSIEIAKEVDKHQKVHTITHGGEFPSYRTDGELLEERTVNIMGEVIETQEDMDNCPNNKFFQPVITAFGLYCQHTMRLMISTALVIPGSSGGPALDSSGKLIGIVSIKHSEFSGFVTLQDIKTFLKYM